MAEPMKYRQQMAEPEHVFASHHHSLEEDDFTA